MPTETVDGKSRMLTEAMLTEAVGGRARAAMQRCPAPCFWPAQDIYAGLRAPGARQPLGALREGRLHADLANQARTKMGDKVCNHGLSNVLPSNLTKP